MKIKAYTIRVIGRVQGVGFRHSARTNARYFGIRGFVRNEYDGSVYIEAEGEAAALEQFIQWCRKGQGFGDIEKLTIEESEVKNFHDFTIKY